MIGAGHSGLAKSRCLTERGIDHVLLERGEIGNSWRRERWDNFRLLTPSWQTRLPGLSRPGGDAPDGYRTAGELVTLLERYAQDIAAPVEQGTHVRHVRAGDGRFEIETSGGIWRARSVVIASGANNRPVVPALASELDARIHEVTPLTYRSPDQLPAGGVLVVGASASGVQIAQELLLAGRQVTVSVGEHVRVPRTYRGRDILWWMDATGLHGQRYEEVDDIRRARSLPSFQLSGVQQGASVDLNTLRENGARIVGRLGAISGTTAKFSGSLRNVCALADLKMNRLLSLIDVWIAEQGIEGEVLPAHQPAPTIVDPEPVLSLDLARERVGSVVWATGCRPDFSWLELPVFDRKRRILHDGGVLPVSGAYLMGMPFLRRRNSGLIDGAGADARDLADHMVGYLSGR